MSRETRVTANVYLQAPDVHVVDLTDTPIPFVGVHLGDAHVFVDNLATVDALDKALAETRAFLTAKVERIRP